MSSLVSSSPLSIRTDLTRTQIKGRREGKSPNKVHPRQVDCGGGREREKGVDGPLFFLFV